MIKPSAAEREAVEVLRAHLIIFQRNHRAIKTEAAAVEVAFKLFGRHRFGIEETLRLIAAALAQPVGLVLHLSPCPKTTCN